MDTLTNKKFAKYDYTIRYLDVPYYFDTLAKRELYGIGSNMLKNSPAGPATRFRPAITLIIHQQNIITTQLFDGLLLILMILLMFLRILPQLLTYLKFQI